MAVRRAVSADKTFTGGTEYSGMVSRVGIGLFLIGSIATILGAFATKGNVVVPDFNG